MDTTLPTPHPLGEVRTTYIKKIRGVYSSRWEISPAEVAGFLRVVGDSNPIHWDEKVAKDYGFEGPIVPGMQILGLASGFIFQALGERVCLGLKFKGKASSGVLVGKPFYMHLRLEGGPLRMKCIVEIRQGRKRRMKLETLVFLPRAKKS